ncbi:MAG: hypothetical protein K6E81_00860 [Lachnospiraceae bacterium]|nr:hypothetical protein [Lachnospiraceae bacterium]
MYIIVCGWISARQDPYAIRLRVTPAELTLDTTMIASAESAEGAEEIGVEGGEVVAVTIENRANRMISSQNDMRTYLVYRVMDASGLAVYTSDQMRIDPRISSGRTGTVEVTVRAADLQEVGVSPGTYRMVFDLQDPAGFFSEKGSSFETAELLLTLR